MDHIWRKCGRSHFLSLLELNLQTDSFCHDSSPFKYWLQLVFSGEKWILLNILRISPILQRKIWLLSGDEHYLKRDWCENLVIWKNLVFCHTKYSLSNVVMAEYIEFLSVFFSEDLESFVVFFVCLFLVFSFNDMESSPLQNLAIQDVVHELGNVLEMSSCRFFHRPIKSEFTYSQNSWWVNDILSFRSFSTTSQHCNSLVVEKQIMVWERAWRYLPLGTAPVQICVGSKQVCGKTSVKEEKNTVGCPLSLLPTECENELCWVRKGLKDDETLLWHWLRPLTSWF